MQEIELPKLPKTLCICCGRHLSDDELCVDCSRDSQFRKPCMRHTVIRSYEGGEYDVPLTSGNF